MDINELKSNEDNREIINKDRQDVKKMYYGFIDLGKELNSKFDAKKKEMGEKLIQEYKEYFSANGFIMNIIDRTIEFTYKDLVVELDDLKDYTYGFYIRKEKISATIVIQEKSIYNNLFYWKHLISDKLIVGGNSDGFFDSITDIKEFKNIKAKLEENISHYQNTIEKLNTIEYIYSLYNSKIECDSFKELFEKYINKT